MRARISSSFGIVLYEMATGVLPFQGDTSGAITNAIINATPTLPVRLNSQVPAELERIIGKALEKKPELRYQSAGDMRVDLTRLLRETQTKLGRGRRFCVSPLGSQPACTAQELEGRRRSRRAAGSPGCWR